MRENDLMLLIVPRNSMDGGKLLFHRNLMPFFGESRSSGVYFIDGSSLSMREAHVVGRNVGMCRGYII